MYCQFVGIHILSTSCLYTYTSCLNIITKRTYYVIYKYKYLYTTYYIPLHTTYYYLCICIYHNTHYYYTDTYVHIDFTYRLQECVYFRQDAHTAAEQTPTPTYHTTTSHTISFKSRVSDLYRHIIMALILLYQLYQITTIFVTERKGNK